MKNPELVKSWLERAQGNLVRAKLGKTAEEIFYEDLCFDAQQTAEKALKALLISLDQEFPWTHAIDVLIKLLEKSGIQVPEKIKASAKLTDYAFKFRYPGDHDPVSREEYQNAIKSAENTYNWVNKILFGK